MCRMVGHYLPSDNVYISWIQRVVNGNHVKWTRAGVRGDERSIENERARARTCYHTGRTHARSMRTTSISKRMSLFTCWDWHQWRREARAILQALSCVHMLSLHGYWILNNEKESRMSDPTWRLITLHWRCQRHNFKHKYFFESLSVCLCACHVPAWDVNLGKERSLATMKNTYTHSHVKLPVDMFFVHSGMMLTVMVITMMMTMILVILVIGVMMLMVTLHKSTQNPW